MRHAWILMLAACGGAQTSTVVVADLDAPEPVRAELTRHFGREAALTLEVEDDDGVTEYEATTQVPMEVELSAGGHLLKIEFIVPLTLAPDAVIAAAERLWPGAQLEQAEVVVEDGVLLWEIEATRGDEELEVYVYPDGRVRSSAPTDADADADAEADSDADADAESDADADTDAESEGP